MKTKGGGRESGEHIGKPRLSEGEASLKRAPVAANPAAPKFYTEEWRWWAAERIRELEAELAQRVPDVVAYMAALKAPHARTREAERP